ncbi:MAG: universal stress protein [Bacteroidota bacterium]|nr:universal stress protein [Candidatus Kapabacteria bacterium]MDW8219095.1 universal stress protein [Bacteroidota bacterium]
MLPIHRILVPHDFSQHAEQALEYAKEIGIPLKATLHLLHVLEPLTTYGSWEGIPMTDLIGRAFAQAEEKLQQISSTLNTLGFESVYTKVMEGHPDIAINGYAEQQSIDLIIMGTHGRRGLEYLLFGSTTEKVLRTAPCSVLAVRLPKDNK